MMYLFDKNGTSKHDVDGNIKQNTIFGQNGQSAIGVIMKCPCEKLIQLCIKAEWCILAEHCGIKMVHISLGVFWIQFDVVGAQKNKFRIFKCKPTLIILGIFLAASF